MSLGKAENVVFIVNVPHSFRSSPQLENALVEHFKPIATPTKVVSLLSSQRCRGQAWVTFATPEEAHNVIQAFNRKEFHGNSLRLQIAKSASKLKSKRERESEEAARKATHDSDQQHEIVIAGSGTKWDQLRRFLKVTDGFLSIQEEAVEIHHEQKQETGDENDDNEDDQPAGTVWRVMYKSAACARMAKDQLRSIPLPHGLTWTITCPN
eukprot:PhF_6_TR25688/c0_g1_i2/m.36207